VVECRLEQIRHPECDWTPAIDAPLQLLEVTPLTLGAAFVEEEPAQLVQIA